MKTRVCVSVCAMAGAIAVGQAGASQFYGVTTAGSLTVFDTTAQTVTTIGNIHAGPTSPTGFEDLEFDAGGTLYAVRAYYDGGFPGTNFNELYRITNLSNANALLSTTIDNSSAYRHTSLVLRPSNGLFYSNRNFDGHLGTLNVTTGAFNDTSGANNGVNTYVEALAINPVTGLSYGIINQFNPFTFTNDATLISLDLSTNGASILGSLGIGNHSAKSLRFDSAGIAYTVDTSNGDVRTINLANGSSTFLFAGGAAAVNTTGLAYVSVPTPAGIALLGLGGLIGLSRRRCRV